MIRGISFRIKQEKNILWKILKCINVKKYNWYNVEDQSEAWHFTDDFKEEPFFKSSIYNGEDFASLIRRSHSIIFLKMEAYEENPKRFDIQSYEEFQKSSCKMLLLIYDCEFVEIYAKDQEIIDSIYENAYSNKFTDVRYICDANDLRKIMSVL